MRILVLGDIIGRPGVRAVVSALRSLVRDHRADMVIVNGENSLDGFGIDGEIAAQLFRAGVDVITTGNHVWHDPSIGELLNREPRLLRPDNYPGDLPGSGMYVHEGRGGRVAVINLQGREFLPAIECPFRRARDLIKRVADTVDWIVVDFHAEATDEKEALAAYLDGQVTLVYGTHTHVATADARLLPRGTAYMTDIGACGPPGSVIGFQPETSVRRVLTQLPLKNEVLDVPAVLHGLVVDTGTAPIAAAIQPFTFRSLV